MHQWMVHSGIPLENAVAYEVAIRSVHYGVDNLNQTSSLLIGVFMMGGNVAHAKSLKGCFGKLMKPVCQWFAIGVGTMMSLGCLFYLC